MAKILVVDDDRNLLYLFPLLLAREGHIVGTVSSIETFYNTLSTFLPDLIILDILFQGRDRRPMCKEIKAKHSSNIPVILMSASGKLLNDYASWNADAGIEKPFDIHVFNKTVNEVLSGYQNNSEHIST
jgi:DNA-binding response OmpR family regulator